MDTVQLVHNLWSTTTPALLCQTFFIVAAAIILGVPALPRDLSGALLTYGARRSLDESQEKKNGGKDKQKQQKEHDKSLAGMRGLLVKLSDYAQVPHGWFLHFYVVAVFWSVFWALQYVAKGTVLRAIATHQAQAGEPSMDLGQVYLAWALITLQGLRRLYESLFVNKSGTSPMFIVHWALGLIYYTCNVFSVWIEGSGAIIESWDTASPTIRLLTPRTAIGVSLFLFASYKQNECHRHLASLKKYTLPDKGWFRYIICPHYTCECLLYVAMSLTTAPPGSLFNRTVLCGLVFAAVNVGVTAHGTQQWYANKFGADKIAGRWKMIPLIF